jgi:VIT1/CCC1 family predicted Fe2+/Mn2+ transporter
MDHVAIEKTLSGSIREIVFGLEDSLVSTLGAVTGIAAGTQNAYIVILSGLVLISVEAVSMAAGSYLSTKSAAGVEATLATKRSHRGGHLPTLPLRAAVVMGISYAFGGLFPIAPYFFVPVASAFVPSLLLTAAALFGTGYWTAHLTHRNPVQSGVEMVGVSLLAAGIGYAIGRLVSAAFGVDAIA